MSHPLLQKALKLIQIRPYSEGELNKKLVQYFPQQKESIQKVIDELKAARLVNDEALAELFVNHWTQKNVGRRRIDMEARKKQLEEGLVDRLLEESGWDEQESARKALEIKHRTLKESDPFKSRQKSMRFLQSRGFGPEVIFTVMK